MSVKLIVALDFEDSRKALNLVDQLDPSLCALKVGCEMFTLFGRDFVRTLVNKNFKVFLDLKFHDIPNTVAHSCIAAADLGVWMIDIHASGGMNMMQAAKKALDPYGLGRPLLIAVTVLTSMNVEDLQRLGIHESVENRVSLLAKLSYDAGLDGVVCSPHEVSAIKALCGPHFLAVTPGIRMPFDSSNDQVRITTPEMALKAGSDYLVVGRPIIEANKPADVVQTILSTIKSTHLS